MSAWLTRSFRDIFTLKQGKYLKKDEMVDEPDGDWTIPVYGANGIIGYTDRSMYEKRVPLVSCRGANCGVTHLTQERCWVSNNSIACLSDEADARFFYHVFRATSFSEVTGGSAQPQITLTSLGPKQIICPPIETQRRIAAILGAYDDLIEVNRRRVAVLEEMARGLFEEWFVRFRFPGQEDVPTLDTPDGPLPKGWNYTSLGGLCPGKTGIQTGPFGSQLHQEDYTDQGVPVVMPKNIIDLRVVTDGIARIPQGLADSLGRHIMVEGDIVYGRRGDIGRRAFISNREDGFFCGTGCLRLRPEPSQAAPRYLFMALGTTETEGSIKARATGATMPNLSVGVMKDVPVLQPTLEVQEHFCTVVEPMLAVVSNLLAANVHLAASRDLLLPRLISGQLSVEAAERQLEDAA